MLPAIIICARHASRYASTVFFFLLILRVIMDARPSRYHYYHSLVRLSIRHATRPVNHVRRPSLTDVDDDDDMAHECSRPCNRPECSKRKPESRYARYGYAASKHTCSARYAKRRTHAEAMEPERRRASMKITHGVMHMRLMPRPTPPPPPSTTTTPRELWVSRCCFRCCHCLRCCVARRCKSGSNKISGRRCESGERQRGHRSATSEQEYMNSRAQRA